MPEAAAAFLPHGGLTRVIATSRGEGWGGLARQVALGPLPATQRARLLLGREPAGEDGLGAVRLAWRSTAGPRGWLHSATTRGAVGGGRWIRTTRRVRVRAPGFFDGSPLARAVRLLRAALPAEEPGAWRLMDLLSFLAPCVPEAVLPDTAATAAPPALAGSGLAWRAGRGGRAMAEVWRKTLSLEGTEAAAEARSRSPRD